MQMRRKLARAGRWFGLAAVVLMAGVYVPSAWYTLVMALTPRFAVAIIGGGVGVRWWGPVYVGPPMSPRAWVEHDQSASIGWMPEGSIHGWPRRVWVPLWIPLVAVGVPTGILWRDARREAVRARVGLCGKCGYDRRGLASAAKCPECGTVPAPAVPGRESQEGRRAPFASASEHPHPQDR